MICPKCKGSTRVIDSRPNGNLDASSYQRKLMRGNEFIQRRRECIECGHKMTTFELSQSALENILRHKKLSKNTTSGYTGVHWYSKEGKWRAKITVNKVVKLLGRFADVNDAIAARKKAENKYNE